MIRAFIVSPSAPSGLEAGEFPTAANSPSDGHAEIVNKQIETLEGIGISDVTVIHPDGASASRRGAADALAGIHGHALFVRYDAILDRELLHFVTHSPTDSVILSAGRTSHVNCREPVEHRDGRLTAAGSSIAANDDHAEEFYGVALLRRDAAEEFLRIMRSKPTAAMSDVLDRLCREHPIQVECWTPYGGGVQRKIGGGSYANSNVVSRFRKEARDLGRRKLRDEIRFLRSLPPDLQPLYPRVYGDGEDEDMIFMEQEYLPLVSLRRHIFAGTLDEEAVVAKLEHILGALHQMTYIAHAMPCPDDYLDQFHFRRVWHRLRHTLDRAPIFGDLFAAKKLWINGRACWNVPSLLARLETSGKLRRLAKPDHVSPFVHSDLHFENILVDPASDDFKLVDPRGYEFCDFYYDLGKLSHSTNGKYDFLHEGRFDLRWSVEDGEAEAELAVHPSRLLTFYDRIDAALRVLYRDVTGDPLALERALFVEAMHFCSDMPFHLKDDGQEAKSIAIYLTGVLLLNDLPDIFDLRFDGDGKGGKVAVRPEDWDRLEWRHAG